MSDKEPLVSKPSSSSGSSGGMSKNTKIGIIFASVFGGLILITIIAIIVIGKNMANHMKLVQAETAAQREKELKAVADRDPADMEATKEEEAANALAAQRRAALAALEVERKKAADDLAADKVSAEDMAKANMEVIVAPTQRKEMYVLDPQRRLEFYNEDTRGFNNNLLTKSFEEKFQALTRDGVVFDEYGTPLN